MIIDGPLWFAAALIICGAHAIFLLSWQREYRRYRVYLERSEAEAQARHEAFMQTIEQTFAEEAGDE